MEDWGFNGNILAFEKDILTHILSIEACIHSFKPSILVWAGRVREKYEDQTGRAHEVMYGEVVRSQHLQVL